MVASRLLIEYDGTEFLGWAAQPGERTVQAELERVLAILLPSPVALTVAGRTDAGVHAWGQVASYPGAPVSLRSLNALLPADVAVTACVRAPEGFDARRDALSRTYCFRLLTRGERSPFERRTALHVHQPLDRGALDACAAALVGVHDFTAFTPTETTHVLFRRRVLSARWHERPGGLELWITGESFLRHMNRILVGTMLHVATGKRTLEEFTGLLGGAHRRDAGPTAPPHGLALASVAYDQGPAAA